MERTADDIRCNAQQLEEASSLEEEYYDVALFCKASQGKPPFPCFAYGVEVVFEGGESWGSEAAFKTGLAQWWSLKKQGTAHHYASVVKHSKKGGEEGEASEKKDVVYNFWKKDSGVHQINKKAFPCFNRQLTNFLIDYRRSSGPVAFCPNVTKLFRKPMEGESSWDYASAFWDFLCDREEMLARLNLRINALRSAKASYFRAIEVGMSHSHQKWLDLVMSRVVGAMMLARVMINVSFVAGASVLHQGAYRLWTIWDCIQSGVRAREFREPPLRGNQEGPIWQRLLCWQGCGSDQLHLGNEVAEGVGEKIPRCRDLLPHPLWQVDRTRS